MKKSEIKIGTEYLKRRSTYGSGTRVVVVNTDAKITQGWGYNRRTISGSTVKNVYDDGTFGPERAVANREIVEEWAPYAARRDAEIAARKASLDRESQARLERAGQVKLLIPALRHAGFEDEQHRLWRGKELTALLEGGLEGEDLVKQDTSERGLAWGDEYIFRVPFARALAEYVLNGSRIPVDFAVFRLLVVAAGQ